MAPTEFNTETCAEDFAGPGREIVGVRHADHRTGSEGRVWWSSERGMHVKVPGWTVSVQWGTSAYAGVRDMFAKAPMGPASFTAEVAAWRGSDGEMIDLNGESVAGWRTPEQVEAAIQAAERDDEDGIRAALADPVDNKETPDGH